MKKNKKYNNNKPNIIRNIYDLTIVVDERRVFGVDKIPISIITRSVAKQIINAINSVIRLYRWDKANSNCNTYQEAFNGFFEDLYNSYFENDKEKASLEQYINAYKVFNLAADYSRTKSKKNFMYDNIDILNIKDELFNDPDSPKVYIGDTDGIRYKIFKKKKFKEGFNTANEFMCIDNYNLNLMNDIAKCLIDLSTSYIPFDIRDISSFHYINFVANN